MAERRWTRLLWLLLTFTAATGQTSLYILEGDEVALPCLNPISDRTFCDGTTWRRWNLGKSEKWVTLGGVSGDMDQLTVSPHCSLVIKKVTTEDAGVYYCHSEYDASTADDEDDWEDGLVSLHVISIRRDSSTLDYLMLAMRGAELLLVTVVTVLLIRALRDQRSCDDSSRRRTKSEDDEDEDYDYPSPPV